MSETRFLIHVLDNKQENLADFQDLFEYLGEDYKLFSCMKDLTNHIVNILSNDNGDEIPDLFIFDKDSFDAELDTFFKFISKNKISVPIIETSSSLEKLIISEKPDEPSKIILEKPIKVNQLAFLISLFKREKQFIDKVRRDQEEIFHANRLMETGTIASGIAHEINNPNTFIALNINYLKKVFNDKEYLPEEIKSQVVKSLDSISNGSSRITKIVNSLASFIRKSKSKKTAVEPVDFINSMEDTLSFLKNNLFQIEISVQNELTNSIIDIDPTHLAQILTNILQNSGDALKESLTAKPKIVILLQNITDEYLTCSISDNGPGIPADIKDSILTPFFSTKGNKGVGLGLHVVSQMVASYGGVLSFDNNESGGATFVFTIPTNLGE